MNRLAVSVALSVALGGLAAMAQLPESPMTSRPATGDPGGVAPPPAASTSDVAAAETGAPQGLPRSARDPFWPVGYVPPPVIKPGVKPAAQDSGSAVAPAAAVAAATARPEDWEEARRHLEVKGISRMGRDKTSGRPSYFADVNGRIVEDGDPVSVTWDGRVYRWRITQVSPTELQLVKLDCRAE